MSPAHFMSVDPLVPLSLLEAVREADRLDGDGEAEYAPEFVNKRLGTTDTVYAQIRRYNEAARRGQPIQEDEVVALARLIARRQARKLLARYFGAVLNRSGPALQMDVPARAPVSAGATEPGREYYDAALRELLTLLTLT